MNCIQAQKKFIAHLHEELDSEAQADLINHVADCAGCRSKLEFERLLQESLRSLAVPKASLGFHDRVFEPLRITHPVEKRSYWLGAALAATFLMAVSLSLIFSSEPNTLAQIKMRVNQVKIVQLQFDSPRDFQEVTLSLKLPKNVEIQGFPGKRQIEWKTALSAGANVLALPIIALKPTEAIVIASVIGKEKTKVFKLPIRSLTDQSARLQKES